MIGKLRFSFSSNLQYQFRYLLYEKKIWNSEESHYMIKQFQRIHETNQIDLSERSLGVQLNIMEKLDRPYAKSLQGQLKELIEANKTKIVSSATIFKVYDAQNADLIRIDREILLHLLKNVKSNIKIKVQHGFSMDGYWLIQLYSYVTSLKLTDQETLNMIVSLMDEHLGKFTTFNILRIIDSSNDFRLKDFDKLILALQNQLWKNLPYITLYNICQASYIYFKLDDSNPHKKFLHTYVLDHAIPELEKKLQKNLHNEAILTELLHVREKGLKDLNKILQTNQKKYEYLQDLHMKYGRRENGIKNDQSNIEQE